MVGSEMYDDKLAYIYVKTLDFIKPLVKLFNWHLKRRGIPVVYFCMNEEEDMDMVNRLGISGVMTDVPTKMGQYIQKKGY